MKIQIEVCDWCRKTLSDNEFQNHRTSAIALCGDCADKKAFGEGYSRTIARCGSAALAKEAMINLISQYK